MASNEFCRHIVPNVFRENVYYYFPLKFDQRHFTSYTVWSCFKYLTYSTGIITCLSVIAKRSTKLKNIYSFNFIITQTIYLCMKKFIFIQGLAFNFQDWRNCRWTKSRKMVLVIAYWRAFTCACAVQSAPFWSKWFSWKGAFKRSS